MKEYTVLEGTSLQYDLLKHKFFVIWARTADGKKQVDQLVVRYCYLLVCDKYEPCAASYNFLVVEFPT